MKHRAFANAEHQALYDELRLLRPDLASYRALGIGGNSYVDGYTRPDQAPLWYPQGTLAHASWAAGVDNGRDDREAAAA